MRERKRGRLAITRPIVAMRPDATGGPKSTQGVGAGLRACSEDGNFPEIPENPERANCKFRATAWQRKNARDVFGADDDGAPGCDSKRSNDPQDCWKLDASA